MTYSNTEKFNFIFGNKINFAPDLFRCEAVVLKDRRANKLNNAMEDTKNRFCTHISCNSSTLTPSSSFVYFSHFYPLARMSITGGIPLLAESLNSPQVSKLSQEDEEEEEDYTDYSEDDDEY